MKTRKTTHPQSPSPLDFRSESGIALATALLALSMLTLIGVSMTFVSSTEVLINQNSRMKLVNLYLAESASEEARERVKELLANNQLSFTDASKVVYIVSNPSINPMTVPPLFTSTKGRP